MSRSDRALINSANASRRADGFWRDADRIATLQLMWAAGEFTSDIAAAIGNGCTKDMVISKAHGLKLPKRMRWQRFGPPKAALSRVARETSEGVPA